MSCLRVTFFLAIGVLLVGFIYSDVLLFGQFNVEGETWFKLFAVRATAFYIYLVSIALFVAALFKFNDAIRLGASQTEVEKNSCHFLGSTIISVGRFVAYGS